METMGNKIKTLRKTKNLSLRDLAIKLDLSDTALSKIETGKTKSITVDLGKKLCIELGASFTELFEIANNTPDIEKLQAEINNLASIIKDKNERIKEKDALIESLIQSNKHLKGQVILHTEMEYIAESWILKDQIVNCKDENERQKLKAKLFVLNKNYEKAYDFFLAVNVLTNEDIDDYRNFYDKIIRQNPDYRNFNPELEEMIGEE